jgi:hypothetical protein
MLRYYLQRPTVVGIENHSTCEWARACVRAWAGEWGRHVRPFHSAARAGFPSHLHPFPLRPIPTCLTTLLSACPLGRRVRAFVAQLQREQQREYPIEAASTRGDRPARVGLPGRPRRRNERHEARSRRALEGVPSPGGTRGYSWGSSKAVLEVVKGAPPWYATRYSRALKEAHTRRRDGRHDGVRRESWRACRRGCPCADARAAMDRTKKADVSTRRVPAGGASSPRAPVQCTHFLGVPPKYPRVHPMSTSTPGAPLDCR